MLMPSEPVLFKSINRNFPYLTRVSIVVLALVVVIFSELSASTTWSAAPSAISSMEVVNRTQKGTVCRCLESSGQIANYPSGVNRLSVLSFVLR